MPVGRLQSVQQYARAPPRWSARPRDGAVRPGPRSPTGSWHCLRRRPRARQGRAANECTGGWKLNCVSLPARGSSCPPRGGIGSLPFGSWPGARACLPAARPAADRPCCWSPDGSSRT
eukprot:375236-Prymnesium_polylepis.1